MLSINLLGSPCLYLNNDPINITRHKAIALLVYLAVTRQPHGRTALASMLFPERDHESGLAYLRRMLYELKSAIGNEYLLVLPKTIAVDYTSPLWVDVNEFCSLLHSCQSNTHDKTAVCQDCLPQLETAVRLYRGDFLQGFTIKDASDFDEWQNWQSSKLQQEMIYTLARLADYYHQYHDLHTAVEKAQQMLTLDPLDESAHRRLIAWYVEMGRHTTAYRQYETCVSLLAEKLDVPPQPETTLLYEQVCNPARKNADGRSLSPIDRAAETLPSNNLPFFLTRFFGREIEIKEITQRLEIPHCRLLTIIGPGGIGKSRLSIEVGRECVAKFQQGVFFVPLASVASSSLIAPTIADAINFHFYGKESLRTQLLNYLRKKEMLLILDNFEHLLSGSDLLLEILHTAPKVKLLITTRASLNYQAEWLYAIDGLPYPQQGKLPLLQDFAAIQLFTERAKRVWDRFSLVEDETSHMIQICQLVEGMPLALELAATLVRTHTCHQIAADLKQNIELLKTTMGDVPPRHRGLQTVIEGAWQQLISEEQILAQKLSVFRSGFTQEAASFVAETSPYMLAGLADKSFIRNVGHDRYEMHEVIRKFIQSFGQLDKNMVLHARERHCQYYAEFLSSKEGALLKGERNSIEDIAVEIENIRAGWHFCTLSQNERILRQLTMPLYLYFESRSLFQEGAQVFREAFTAIREAHSQRDKRILGVLLAIESRFYLKLGYLDKTKAISKESLSYLPVNAKREHAFVLHTLDMTYRFEGLFKEALDYSEKSLFLYQSINDLHGIAALHYECGTNLIYLGQSNKALESLEESLAICQQYLYRRIEALALNGLCGLKYFMDADHGEIHKLLQKCISAFREIGDQQAIAMSLHNMAYAMINNGKVKESIPYFCESLAITQALGDQWGEAKNLQGLGESYLNLDDYELAQNHLYKCIQINREIGSHMGVSIALGCLGASYLGLDKLDMAQECLVEAILIDKRNNSITTIIGHIIRFALIYEKREDSAKARQYMLAVKHDERCPKMWTRNVEDYFIKFSYRSLQKDEERVLSLDEVVDEILQTSENW